MSNRIIAIVAPNRRSCRIEMHVEGEPRSLYINYDLEQMNGLLTYLLDARSRMLASPIIIPRKDFPQ